MSSIDPLEAGQKRTNKRMRAQDCSLLLLLCLFGSATFYVTSACCFRLECANTQQEVIRQQNEEGDDHSERDVHRVVQPVVANEELCHAPQLDADQIHDQMRTVDDPHARQ